jgi:8-hydroxy-5-deazaflavin:NADPH oxidoreductase
VASKPRIGIIGRGNMGGVFAQGLARHEYPVSMAGHDPAEAQRVARESDVVVLAVPYVALAGLIPVLGPVVGGKVVVDISNLMGPNFTFLGTFDESGAERLQRAWPDARVVKCFNTVFSAYVDGGQIGTERLTAFAASDDAGAKRIVLAMAADLGLEPVDAGPLRHARWLEAMGYYHVAMHETVGWDHGLRLVQEHPA